jgi:hypothetical protein
MFPYVAGHWVSLPNMFLYYHAYNGFWGYKISHIFLNIYLFSFFIQFENDRSTIGFSTWKVENTPIFYNSEGLHIVRIVSYMSD